MRTAGSYKNVKRNARFISDHTFMEPVDSAAYPAHVFSPEYVKKKFSENSESQTYRQLKLDFEKEHIRKALDNMGVKKNDVVVSAAGYNGNFARAIRESGNKVIFTDINERWVNNAKKGIIIDKNAKIAKAEPIKGFVMDMVNPHFDDKKVSAIVSFEPTPVWVSDSSSSAILPNLGPKNGFIFVSEKKEEGHSSFDPSLKHGWADQKSLVKMALEYGIQIRSGIYGDKTKLHYVQFMIPEEKKTKYLFDRECSERIQKGELADSIAKKMGSTAESVREAAKRYKSVKLSSQYEY